MKNYRRPIALVLLIVSVGPIAAESSAQEAPDYDVMMAINAFIPGYAQYAMGRTAEGVAYMATGLSLGVVGFGLTTYAMLERLGGVVFDVDRSSGTTVLFRYREKPEAIDHVLFWSGTTLSLYGSLIGSYSSYAAHRDYVDTYGGDGLPDERDGRESILGLLSAPFVPRNVFNMDVLPALSLMVLSDFAGSDLGRIGTYFRRESVPFMGMTLDPWTAFGLRLGTAALMVGANAAWEEIAFRGLSLERDGLVLSSVTFGTAHLGNMLLPGWSVEDVLLQTLYATGFGFYAAQSVIGNEHRLERVIALHFWHNLIGIVLSYVVNPEEETGFTIGARLVQ